MRITELFTAKSIELDSAASNRDEILSRLVELQATHGNITDTEAYKKALYAREDEASTYVDNGITVPHAKTNVVTRPSLAALRLSTPAVSYTHLDVYKRQILSRTSAMLAARSMSSGVASSTPKAMLWAMVSENRKLSCGT